MSRFLAPAPRLCDCGSELYSEWEYDGNGIELCRTCPKCRKARLAGYRPEVLRPYGQNEVDEPIESD
jgi:hypothetical protein